MGGLCMRLCRLAIPSSRKNCPTRPGRNSMARAWGLMLLGCLLVSIQVSSRTRGREEEDDQPKPFREQKGQVKLVCARWRGSPECEQRHAPPARCGNSQKPFAGLSPFSDLFPPDYYQRGRKSRGGSGAHPLGYSVDRAGCELCFV